MTDETSQAAHDSERFRELLDKAVKQADEMIADFKAQDPATIDLVGRVGSLPGKVLDVLVAMKDQLNDESRAAIDDWEESSSQRFIEQYGLYGQTPLQRAMLEMQEDPLQRAMREWQNPNAEIQRAMWDMQESPVARQMREWREREDERRRKFWEQIELSERRFRDSLPPNWKSPDVDFPDLEQLTLLQQTEGLPLAWVPPNHVLSEILACKTSGGRRRVIARESPAILSACLRELRRLRSEETKDWRSSARQAAIAMKAGHWRAGQALAANALDSATFKFIQSSYPDAVRQSRNGKGGKVKIATPPGSSEQSLPTWHDVDYPRALLVLHSIYGAFGEFDRGGGGPVPTQFTRHATVHTVSRRQYNKANALIALMHIVGLLCLIEDE